MCPALFGRTRPVTTTRWPSSGSRSENWSVARDPMRQIRPGVEYGANSSFPANTQRVLMVCFGRKLTSTLPFLPVTTVIRSENDSSP